MRIRTVGFAIVLLPLVTALTQAKPKTGNDVGDEQCSAVTEGGESVHKGKCKDVCGDNEVARDTLGDYGSTYKCSATKGQKPPARRHSAEIEHADVAPAGGFPPTVDFKPISLTNETFCDSNGETLKITVINLGKRAAAAPVGARFEDGSFYKAKTSSIPHGAYRSVNVRLPARCRNFHGECEFTITVDPANKVQEADESNNVAKGYCIH